MIGLGTFYNALGVVFGGLLGLLIGQRLSEDFHETLLKVTGVAVFVLGIAGTLEKMLVVHGSHVESHGSMMLILSLVLGTVLGELLKIEEGLEHLGTWLKEKTGNQGDTSFVDAFMTTALTICIGAMAVVGAVQDGLTGDTSTLLAKAILDMVIVLVLTVSKGKDSLLLHQLRQFRWLVDHKEHATSMANDYLFFGHYDQSIYLFLRIASTIGCFPVR